MLAGVSRAGPSYPLLPQNVLRASPRRHMAKAAARPEGKLRKSGFRAVERDERGAIIPKKKEQSLGAFRALPPANLTHPAFKSNDRAVLNLPVFTPSRHLLGQAAEFNLTDNDPVRMFGLPKKMLLEFRLLSKPCSVVRDITVHTAELLGKAGDKSSLETRLVLNGQQGCGKSYLMLQTVEHCVSSGWIVIYIPRAVKLVNSTTSYEYDLRTRTYLQPKFAFQTLQRLQTVNKYALSGLTTSKKLVFEKREIPLGTNLADLVGAALKDPPLAPLILDALMTELSIQTKHPVLLAVDDFQALYCRTAYRDPHFIPIRSYHLAIPRMIMEFASGKRSFAKGAFLGALTTSDTNYKTPLELRDALGLPEEHAASPYHKRSQALAEYTHGLQALNVPDQMSVAEAASLFEVWMKDRALVPSSYDELFLSKYTESSGNPRDFVWKGLLATLEP
ncbi:37S ribosomal protein S23, mitochondrial [Hypsizygus marmoreus]|uniref:Small ribosomal subunit protein mS29 n=1 Tax=Hypsizygus marmoreus TaxID=39966 RepID=A0A369J663_HYPMA|nr:37S ribosomal protein S23, mitochondrial [Hypsizygus marmoreus]